MDSSNTAATLANASNVGENTAKAAFTGVTSATTWELAGKNDLDLLGFN